jgi:hypothetical protein
MSHAAKIERLSEKRRKETRRCETEIITNLVESGE